MCWLSWNLGALTSWNPQGMSGPVTRIALPPHTSPSFYPRPASATGSSEFKSCSRVQLTRLSLPQQYLELDLNRALFEICKILLMKARVFWSMRTCQFTISCQHFGGAICQSKQPYTPQAYFSVINHFLPHPLHFYSPIILSLTATQFELWEILIREW